MFVFLFVHLRHRQHHHGDALASLPSLAKEASLLLFHLPEDKQRFSYDKQRKNNLLLICRGEAFRGRSS